MLFIRWASICLLHDQLTMLLLCTFFDTWRTLSSMAFSTQLNLLLCFVHSLMLIGQGIPLITTPLQVIAFSLVLLRFLSEVRNKLLWPALTPKQNIVPLLIPHLSSFGYDGFLRIWVCPHPLLLSFIVTTRVPFILLIMMSSMNGLIHRDWLSFYPLLSCPWCSQAFLRLLQISTCRYLHQVTF